MTQPNTEQTEPATIDAIGPRLALAVASFLGTIPVTSLDDQASLDLQALLEDPGACHFIAASFRETAAKLIRFADELAPL